MHWIKWTAPCVHVLIFTIKVSNSVLCSRFEAHFSFCWCFIISCFIHNERHSCSFVFEWVLCEQPSCSHEVWVWVYITERFFHCYTAKFSLHQVHGSQCTKAYYTVLLKDTGWRVHGKWGTTRSPLLPGTTVNTPQWPWMCPPGRQWQGTFDCPLPWGTSIALGCRVPTVGHCSTTVAHYSTTLQPTCSY